MSGMVSDLGSRVESEEFSIEDLRLRVWISRFRICDSGLTVYGLWFGDCGLGFRV